MHQHYTLRFQKRIICSFITLAMFSSKVFLFFCFSQDLCAIDALWAEISVQTPPKKEKKGKPGTALNVKLNLSLPVPTMIALEGCECLV